MEDSEEEEDEVGGGVTVPFDEDAPPPPFSVEAYEEVDDMEETFEEDEEFRSLELEDDFQMFFSENNMIT